MTVRIKRVYDRPARADGVRVLVDGLWPRGLTKGKARVDLWLRDIAPTAGLRKWFAHDPEKWPEFRKRYRAELKGGAALKELRLLCRGNTVTLVYAARDAERNNARVLEGLLR